MQTPRGAMALGTTTMTSTTQGAKRTGKLVTSHIQSTVMGKQVLNTFADITRSCHVLRRMQLQYLPS